MFQIKVAEKIETLISRSKPLSGIRAFRQIMWQNMAEPIRPQMTNNTVKKSCHMHAG
jgi:hypothetical protein